MFVSVIIPVYNAEKYVREAVESALEQPETGEVILIEDDSPDNSLQVCKELCREYPKLKLLRHRDRKNHGAGASRNLGILAAKHDYIAFLDADDFFLPGRFTVAKRLFESDPETEGVYEAVGAHFEKEGENRRWVDCNGPPLKTMIKRVPPNQLFEAQAPVGGSGHCCTNGWVVKRKLFDKTGLFDECLRLHQDTAMFVKFSGVGQMVPGRLDEPVAIYRRHENNRYKGLNAPSFEAYSNRVLMWGTLWKWGKNTLDETRQHILLKRLIEYANRPHNRRKSHIINRIQATIHLMILVLQFPGLRSEPLFWKKLLANFSALGKAIINQFFLIPKLP